MMKLRANYKKDQSLTVMLTNGFHISFQIQHVVQMID
jgi:hypothetical protein